MPKSKSQGKKKSYNIVVDLIEWKLTDTVIKQW
jgi:hypothetical protein